VGQSVTSPHLRHERHATSGTVTFKIAGVDQTPAANVNGSGVATFTPAR